MPDTIYLSSYSKFFYATRAGVLRKMGKKGLTANQKYGKVRYSQSCVYGRANLSW